MTLSDSLCLWNGCECVCVCVCVFQVMLRLFASCWRPVKSTLFPETGNTLAPGNSRADSGLNCNEKQLWNDLMLTVIGVDCYLFPYWFLIWFLKQTQVGFLRLWSYSLNLQHLQPAVLTALFAAGGGTHRWMKQSTSATTTWWPSCEITTHSTALRTTQTKSRTQRRTWTGCCEGKQLEREGNETWSGCSEEGTKSVCSLRKERKERKFCQTSYIKKSLDHQINPDIKLYSGKKTKQKTSFRKHSLKHRAAAIPPVLELLVMLLDVVGFVLY